jgi:hypothetical protein
MLPVPGLCFLRRLRPGTAEVSRRYIFGLRDRQMLIVKSDREQPRPRSASIERRHYLRTIDPGLWEARAGLVPDGWDRLSVRQGFCSFARRAGPLARTMSATASPCKAVWRATRAAS